MIEILVTIGILAILVAITLPAVQKATAAANAAKCQHNLRQIGVALGSYQSRHGHFPLLWAGGFRGDVGYFSVHVHLLPDLQHQPLFDQVNFTGRTPTLTGFTVAPTNTTAANVSIATFLCPADAEPAYRGYGPVSYRASVGPTVFKKFGNNIRPSNLIGSGAFVTLKALRPADFTDGLSHTAMFSEKPRGSGGDTFRSFVGFWQTDVWWGSIDEIVLACREPLPDGAPIQNTVGYSWFLPTFRNGVYNHNVAPNSSVPDCTGPGADSVDLPYTGSFAARSYHSSGAHALFGDGRVQFVPAAINTKIWRALGTRAGNEAVPDL